MQARLPRADADGLARARARGRRGHGPVTDPLGPRKVPMVALAMGVRPRPPARPYDGATGADVYEGGTIAGAPDRPPNRWVPELARRRGASASAGLPSRART